MNGTRSRRASRRPIVVLPAPRRPRRAIRGCTGSADSVRSAAGVVSSARATSARRRTEMLPRPASSCTRNRGETPDRSATSRSVHPRSNRSARARQPSAERSGRVMWTILHHHEDYMNYSALTVIHQPGTLDRMATDATALPKVSFETSPDRYRHWKLAFDGPVATLSMDVREDAGLSPDYRLKLNSYDLGVDIELADAIQRIRFEHPEVHAVVVTSLKERIFCAGANIFMLRGSTHAWKVNFCKFTNETRLAMEDASAHSGIAFLAALNGICAGGGYELALACDEILLVDDANSAVSLPETPLLGVLPGTGGLTRVVDKRRVRRDLADVFGTLAEGVKGKRAVEWGLVDAVAPASRFKEAVAKRAAELASQSDRPAAGPGIKLGPLSPKISENALEYSAVTMTFD